jgi:hypothetical protein
MTSGVFSALSGFSGFKERLHNAFWTGAGVDEDSLETVCVGARASLSIAEFGHEVDTIKRL